jgi:hypothetical protein
MSVETSYQTLEQTMLSLDPSSMNCREKIADLRRLMDESCDLGLLTLQQWRTLLDKVSLVQEKCARHEPDGWRVPSRSGHV